MGVGRGEERLVVYCWRGSGRTGGFSNRVVWSMTEGGGRERKGGRKKGRRGGGEGGRE